LAAANRLVALLLVTARATIAARSGQLPTDEYLSRMGWSEYGEFLIFALVVVVIPGPDFAVVTKNTLVAGRRRGRWTAGGVVTAAFVQGTAAAAGLSALVVRAQPVFEAVKWAGVCYLTFLGIQAIRSAIRGRYPQLDVVTDARPSSREAIGGWRQGFLSNITNPKVILFYLAILPQFLRPGAAPGWLLAFAWSHAVITLVYLMLVVSGLHRLRRLLGRRRVRRTMDGITGAVLLGFGARLAAERA
jgi:threonine/homoserine/homoserine lactone efflux protein